jgi:hypothetical protein
MPKIEELYAYVLADKDENDEGVPAVRLGETVLPLMGADMERMVGRLREVAQSEANRTGKEIKLIKSTGIEVVETIRPE